MKMNSSLLFAAYFLLMPTAQAATLSDIANSPKQSAIQYLNDKGVIGGYPDGTFRPENTVNRAELGKILVGGLGVQPSSEQYKNCFPDVKTEWFAPFICYAKEQGWVSGYPDGSFKPNQTVNYAEALKMSYNAFVISTPDIGGEWYNRFLRHAQINGVLFDNKVRIDSGMSRGDVAWVVWKLSTHTGEWEQPSPPSLEEEMIQFLDESLIENPQSIDDLRNNAEAQAQKTYILIIDQLHSIASMYSVCYDTMLNVDDESTRSRMLGLITEGNEKMKAVMDLANQLPKMTTENYMNFDTEALLGNIQDLINGSTECIQMH